MTAIATNLDGPAASDARARGAGGERGELGEHDGARASADDSVFRTGLVLERHSPILQFASVIGDRSIAEGVRTMTARGTLSAPMIDAEDLAEGHGPPALPNHPSDHPSSSGTMVKDALPVLEILREGSEPPRPRVQRTTGRGSAIAKVVAVIGAFAVVGVAAGFGLRAIAGRELARVELAAPTTQKSDVAALALAAKSPPPAPAKTTTPNAQPARATLPPPPPHATTTPALANQNTVHASVNTRPTPIAAKPARNGHPAARTVPPRGATKPVGARNPTANGANLHGPSRVHPRPAAAKPKRPAPPAAATPSKKPHA